MEKQTKEKTLVLIKPDGLVRHLAGKVITRFEDAGLKIISMKMVQIDQEFAEKHYRKDIEERHGKRVRDGLIKYIKEGPVIALVLEGVDAILIVRKITGDTPYPSEALPGTIRGDFAHISKDYANSNKINIRNLVHASADKADSDIEIPLWFNDSELHNYKTAHDMICFEE